jgi:hypothetical protein
MSLPGTWRSLAYALAVSVSMLAVLSCSKKPLVTDRNRPPETFLVSAPVDTSVASLPYSYRLHLYWRGEDSDGYVVGFLWAFDDTSISNFQFTTKTDSIFMLTVHDSSALAGGGGPGTSIAGTAQAHTFYIRAVDNLGKADPSFAIFNRRTYVASTIRPTVTFTGNLPSHTPNVEIDTLCDGTPFRVTWTGYDPDGVPDEVLRYKVNVGSYDGPIMTDSVQYFNDPSQPGSIAISSGLYTMTVTAFDIANALGTSAFQFVVNRDPETWFLPKGAPIGHYLSYYQKGQYTPFESTFAEGDTVPFRSTVWFDWDGEDGHNGCEYDSLTGFSFNLQPGSHNDNEPYIIGFLDVLYPGPPPVRFTSNDPSKLGPLGFTTLILDSLDAGHNFIARVASRDRSGRADGTPATFRFNCNFPPQLDSLSVDSVFTIAETGFPAEPCKLVKWQGVDPEDGLTKYATITLDGTLKKNTDQFEQSIIIPERTFRALSPLNPHLIQVVVRDRAQFESTTTLTTQTTVVYP